jgi:hypothetical protein
MKNQKAHNFAVVVAAAMLLATVATSMATSVDVFAYKKNQAASQANACGNGQIPTNVGCQNAGSQIQGDENSVALAAQQTFPEAEIVVPPDNGNGVVDACEECLAPLLGTVGVASDIAEDLGLGVDLTDEAAITAICEALLNGTIDFSDFVNTLAGFAPDLPAGTVGEIVSCLAQLGIPGGGA